MRKETLDELREALGTWFPSSRPQPDVELASLLLEGKVVARKEDPLLWRPRDVEHLLLQTLPADALLTGDDAPDVLASLRALLTFLEQSGRLAKASAAPADLLAEVTVERLRTALDDRQLWSLNKQVLAAAGASGIDVTDADAMATFARSLVDGYSLPGRDLPAGIELPARRVQEMAVLAQAARGTAAFSAGVELADWVGAGRPVTREHLTKTAALQAQQELGWTAEQVDSTWRHAWDWGLLNVGTRKAQGTDAPADDQEWLDSWQDALGVLLADPPVPDEDRI